jgi:hypothetical protein
VNVIVNGATGAQQSLINFTTQTGQWLDSGAVDIGYHYPNLLVRPATLISGNSAAFGYGPIETYNFADGTKAGSFTPDGAVPGSQSGPNPNGRGIAILGPNIFYTELTNGIESGSLCIHVCPYSMEGYDVPDTRTIKNPRQDADGNPVGGIQDLAFHYDPAMHKTELYVLTGYLHYSPVVYEIDPDSPNGTVTIVGPANGISISVPPADIESDGFAVLPNGNFLINGGDANPVYQEFYGSGPNAGQVRDKSHGGLYVDLSNFGINIGTGVTVSQDGQSLYFIAGIETSHQTLLLTDTSGNLFGIQPISSIEIEDIGVVIPQ